jgi:hypothetical protein
MSSEKRKGRGRLVPTRPTGVEYKVVYGILFTAEVQQHGRAAASPAATRWAKCSVRSAEAHMIPNGSYFLHAEDGRVYQLKSLGRDWHFLATA